MSYQSAFNALLSNARGGITALKVNEFAQKEDAKTGNIEPIQTEQNAMQPTEPQTPKTIFKPASEKAAESLKQKYEEMIRRRKAMEERRKLLEQQRIDELIDKGEI